MNEAERIRAHILQIQDLCAEVLNELDKRYPLASPSPRRVLVREVSAPSEQEAIAEFDRLYASYVQGKPEVVSAFVKDKTKAYLKTFCKANSLAIDTKNASKEVISSEIIHWFAQRKAISGRGP